MKVRKLKARTYIRYAVLRIEDRGTYVVIRSAAQFKRMMGEPCRSGS